MKKLIFLLSTIFGIFFTLPVFAFTDPNFSPYGWQIFNQPSYTGYTQIFNPTAFRFNPNFLIRPPSNGWDNRITGAKYLLYVPTSTNATFGFTIYEAIASTTDGGDYFAAGGVPYADCRTTTTTPAGANLISFTVACSEPNGVFKMTSGKVYFLIDSNAPPAKYYYVGNTPSLDLYTSGNYGNGAVSSTDFESKAVTGGTRFWKVTDSNFTPVLTLYSASTTSSTAPIGSKSSADCTVYTDVVSWSICQLMVTQLTPSDSALAGYQTTYGYIQNKPPFGYMNAYINAFNGFTTHTTSSAIETGGYNFAQLVAAMDNVPFWNTLYNFEITLIWLLFATYVFNRLRHFDI